MSAQKAFGEWPKAFGEHPGLRRAPFCSRLLKGTLGGASRAREIAESSSAFFCWKDLKQNFPSKQSAATLGAATAIELRTHAINAGKKSRARGAAGGACIGSLTTPRICCGEITRMDHAYGGKAGSGI